MGIGRLEAWSRLGRFKTAETLFAEAAKNSEERNWRERLQRAPHGEPWHASFHVSQFPAGDPRTCDRKALYDMMGFPHKEPDSRMLVGTAIMGSAFEEWNLDYLEQDGRLLSATKATKHEATQTKFEDADHWLTGAPDFIVLPPFWNRPHLIETKTKDLEIVAQMKAATRSYDASHARQCRGYIALGNRISPILWPSAIVCRHTWRIAEPGVENVIDVMVCRDHGINADSGCLIEIELEPLRTGSLIYGGRDRPHITIEYFFEHDEEWFASGLEILRRRQEYFRRDELPPHPFGGKQWSELPCQWCDFKRESCKPDHKDGVTKLSESNGVGWATEVYGAYDADVVRQAVLDRWEGRSGVSGRLEGSTRQNGEERVHG